MDHPLRKFRKQSGITLEKLAGDVGVSKGYLSKVETGDHLPSMGLAARLSEATGFALTANDFLQAFSDFQKIALAGNAGADSTSEAAE